MGRAVVKLEDGRYLEWSTVVDAPVSVSLTRNEAVEEWGEERVARADQYGTSFHDPQSAAKLVAYNRAGPKERNLTMEEICEGYKPGGQYAR